MEREEVSRMLAAGYGLRASAHGAWKNGAESQTMTPSLFYGYRCDVSWW